MHQEQRPAVVVANSSKTSDADRQPNASPWPRLGANQSDRRSAKAKRQLGNFPQAFTHVALVNTALESPLGQIAMIPMLAWIATTAPANLKATYFAVMASFTNLALSLALGTLGGDATLSQEFSITIGGQAYGLFGTEGFFFHHGQEIAGAYFVTVRRK